MLPRSLSAPLALALVPLLALTASAQATLRLKFTKDQTNTYEMVQDMNMTMQVGGNNIEMKMRQTIDMAMTVTEVLPDGNARVRTKFQRVRMEMKGLPTGDVDLDSSKDIQPDNPIAQVMGGMIKTMGRTEFNAVMTPRGETVEFKIPEDLLKEFQALPGSAQMGDFFSEKGLKNLMGQSGLVLPKDAVKKGDNWSQKVSAKMPFGQFDTEMKYTYEGPEAVGGKNMEKISFVPQTKIEADPNGAFTLKVESQKGAGTVFFDPDAGRMHEMRLNQLTEMSVTVGNMNINQKLEQTVTMKLK